MNTLRLWAVASAILWSIFGSHSAHAAIVTFGSGAHQFNMEFAEIGSPGNAADTTGNPNPAGAVGYTYNMGKFAVSEDMITKANILGDLGITINSRGVNKPATSVSWFEAAKFVNWLNTSQGHQAAYNFDEHGNFQLWSSNEAWQLDGENLFRHKDAHYWLPSVDEWYKAAYYDPDTGDYWNFATGSDSPPTAVPSGTEDNTAVYNQRWELGPADVTQAGGLSPFGIMGMNGNVWEWEETTFDLFNLDGSSARGIRGGDWNFSSFNLSSSIRGRSNPAVESDCFGFRVASRSAPAVVIPEPSSLAIWGLMGLGLLLFRCRRGRR